MSAKFYKNGASSLDGVQDEVITKTCILEEKYNGEVQDTECSITTPEIKASSATPNVVGYNENKDATSGSVGSKTEITLSSDKEYYAITKSELKTNIATCTSSTPTEKCAKQGNGYAKITLISID